MDPRAFDTQHDTQINARPGRVLPIAVCTLVVAGDTQESEAHGETGPVACISRGGV